MTYDEMVHAIFVLKLPVVKDSATDLYMEFVRSTAQEPVTGDTELG